MNATLVTGASGLLGRAFLTPRWKQATATEVVGLSRSGADPSLLQSDYSEADVVRIASQIPNVSFVVHCAGRASVVQSNLDPRTDHGHNVAPLWFSIEYARRTGAALILISSFEVYGNLASDERREDATCRPESFYGLSKLHGESCARLLHALDGVNVQILRCGVLYGPGMTKGPVFDVISPYQRDASQVTLFCDPESRFDFVHVDDVVDASLHLITTRQPGGTWNVGTGRSSTLSQALDWCSARTGRRLPVALKEHALLDKRASIDKLFGSGWPTPPSFEQRLDRWFALAAPHAAG